MITLKEVTKTYVVSKENSVPAVRGVSLQIEKGEFFFIVGRSGSGKTTLLNLAAGLTRPTSGTVLLDGVDLWALPDEKQSLLRSQKFGFVFQFPSLLPALNTLDNVVLPAIFRKKQKTAKGFARSNGRDHERAVELLQKVGLADKLSAYPRQLSAGQQQRVVIARALMNQPQILLADEPTSNLDEQTELEIMDTFHELHTSLGLTIVMVTHTRQLVSFGTRAVEMASGVIVNGQAHPAA